MTLHCYHLPSATSGDPPSPTPPPPPPNPDLSSSDSDSSSTTTTLSSNLSLQTHPSLSSLQLPTSPISLSPLHILSLPSPISALSLSGHLLYAAAGHRIHLLNSGTLSPLFSFNSHHPSSGAVKSIAFPSPTTILTAHQDSKIRLWSAKSHRLLAVLPTLSDRLRRLPLPHNYVQVRRHKTRLWLHHNDAVSCLVTHPSNTLLYSVSWDKTLKIWRTSDLRCMQSLTAHDDAVNAVTVSPDGVVYTGSADRKIRVWAIPTGSKKHALLTTLDRHKSAVNALALSSDGKVLFSGACDRSILVWNRIDGPDHMVAAGALRGHGKAVLCLATAGDVVVSGSADRTVRIWRRGMDGRYWCMSVLEGHRRPVKSLAASRRSDEVTVFSGSLDGEIRVWKVNV